MMIRKDPPLDQTGGLKDEENEGSMHQLALHLNQLPGVQADLLQGLNLDSCLSPSRPPTPDRDWNKSVPAAQGNVQSWISTLAKQTEARSSFNELLDTPIDFFNFIMNRLGTKAADYGHIKWIEDFVPRAMWIQEPMSYDKHALWGVSQ
nr:hypothetical protein [Tanacetum cinerariifolium]